MIWGSFERGTTASGGDRGREPPDGARGFLPPLPQGARSHVVGGHTDRHGAVTAADDGDALGLRLDLGARSIELDEQHRVGGIRVDLADAGV